ncbi:nuclear transport factor 2 family protein [Burkholderia sp. BCC1977]|uniref:nuclear transport factor 2 family protein n=1 Tax=Burkholderia sp. BCC1977 TaxID=2817440 RepID=UPI002ABD82B8|nr:nuclear transport factor 2 family protein [Burkholderia sp. BCC1977]
MDETVTSWSCEQLSLQVSRWFDLGDFERAAALFTEDAEFIRPSTYPNLPLRGRAAIQELGKQLPAGVMSRHVCSNFIVEVQGKDRVVCRSLFTRFGDNRPEDTRQQPLPIAECLRSVGEYEEHMVRTPEGWRIASRIGRFIFGGI